MTITYSLDVASSTFLGLHRLLLRWKGSIWKSIWPELFCWLAAYFGLALWYRFLMDREQQMFANGKRGMDELLELGEDWCHACRYFLPFQLLRGSLRIFQQPHRVHCWFGPIIQSISIMLLPASPLTSPSPSCSASMCPSCSIAGMRFSPIWAGSIRSFFSIFFNSLPSLFHFQSGHSDCHNCARQQRRGAQHSAEHCALSGAGPGNGVPRHQRMRKKTFPDYGPSGHGWYALEK